MKQRTAPLLVIVGVLTWAVGCSDDEDGCPDISGSWQITNHCDPSAIGSTISLSQSGCVIDQIAPWPDWSGSLDAQGEMIWSGPAGGGATMVCSATLSGGTITASCTPACNVTVVRR